KHQRVRYQDRVEYAELLAELEATVLDDEPIDIAARLEYARHLVNERLDYDIVRPHETLAVLPIMEAQAAHDVAHVARRKQARSSFARVPGSRRSRLKVHHAAVVIVEGAYHRLRDDVRFVMPIAPAHLQHGHRFGIRRDAGLQKLHHLAVVERDEAGRTHQI